MKRPAWVARRIETQKALRALPKCEWCGIKRGMGFSREGSWLCPKCAQKAQNLPNHPPADAPRET